MSNLADFEITKRWPATEPNKIQLYSYPTPNGLKISIALEEMELGYEAHRVTLSDDDVKSPAFLSLNPNNKIPAIIDPNGPDGQPIGIFESGAILIYLAEKTGKFLGKTASDKYKIIQWVMFQMAGLGPMSGQLGFFTKFAGAEIEDPRPRQRYLDETLRLLGVLDRHLEGREWMHDDFSIADMAMVPWLNAYDFYGVKAALNWDEFKNLPAYRDRFNARAAVVRAQNVPPR